MTRNPITALRAEGLTIGAASHRTGVNIETIRYHEKIMMLPPSQRTAGGRCVYGTEDVRRLAFIRRGRELELTLGGYSRAAPFRRNGATVLHAGLRGRHAPS